jgi:putative transcriptional regulator
MISHRGKFLTAAPNQLDPNFYKAVVLVVEHTERGAYGLIVNCPTSGGGRLRWRHPDGRLRKSGKLFWGGPVAGLLMAVHKKATLAERQVMPGIFFSAKRENVVALLSKTTRSCKLFAGYAGWGPKQLDDEVARGAWRVVPATPEQIFSDDRGLWEQLLQQASRLQLRNLFRIKHIPADPLLN